MRPQLVPELGCSNFQVSRKFYIEILGFKVHYEREGFCYLKRDDVEIMIEQLSETSWKSAELQQPFGRAMHFQIMIADLSSLYERCVANHVPIFLEQEEVWYRADKQYFGQCQFIITDPDGYMLRFAEDIGSCETPPQDARIVS